MNTAERSGAIPDASRLGFTEGQTIQEFGYDDDIDFDLRNDLVELLNEELVDEDYDDVCDGAIVWWRDGDGDLTDMLVDALTILDDEADVWLLTLKPGREGHVGHADIDQAARTAGLNTTNTMSIAEDWSATRLNQSGRRS